MAWQRTVCVVARRRGGIHHSTTPRAMRHGTTWPHAACAADVASVLAGVASSRAPLLAWQADEGGGTVGVGVALPLGACLLVASRYAML